MVTTSSSGSISLISCLPPHCPLSNKGEIDVTITRGLQGGIKTEPVKFVLVKFSFMQKEEMMEHAANVCWCCAVICCLGLIPL